MMPTGTPMKLPRRDNRPVEPLDIKSKFNGKESQMQDSVRIKKSYAGITERRSAALFLQHAAVNLSNPCQGLLPNRHPGNRAPLFLKRYRLPHR